MKKIMFSDRFGLTKAVLEGRKTMTRRIAGLRQDDDMDNGAMDIFAAPTYKVGEVVAVAQSYEDIFTTNDIPLDEWIAKVENAHAGQDYCLIEGTDNKMFVKAELMPHQIRITGVRIERLQDINDGDCKREGIDYVGGYSDSYYFGHGAGNIRLGNSYREAFAALIDKVSGKGTWDSNPYVFVYDFELVK